MTQPSNDGAFPSRIRIFLSSPGDVQPERERCEAIVKALDAELENIHLELVRWEEGVYRATSTFQNQIVSPGDCDLVVLSVLEALGGHLCRQTSKALMVGPRSGTEYEFEQALETARMRDDGLPDIFVYRKMAPVQFAEERVDQERAEKQALDGFWAKWFRDEEGHFLAAFHTFDQTDEFARYFERHLRIWLNEQRQTDWDIASQGSPFRGLRDL